MREGSGREVRLIFKVHGNREQDALACQSQTKELEADPSSHTMLLVLAV